MLKELFIDLCWITGIVFMISIIAGIILRPIKAKKEKQEKQEFIKSLDKDIQTFLDKLEKKDTKK